MAGINLHISSKSSASAETDPEWTRPSLPVRPHTQDITGAGAEAGVNAAFSLVCRTFLCKLL